ncbi:MAG: DNA-binding response regulator [Proteobacteria bacterium]|nr:MAG: DNA-binding response regulator [Pseudomonadota bacterium]
MGVGFTMTRGPVVVVEDDRELGELVVEAFRMELGDDVRLITHGGQAMDWLQSDLCASKLPSLLILDMHLPGVSGLDILDYVKSCERFAATRIIVITADSALLQRARGKADWLLLKPLAYSHIVEIARWYLAKTQSEARDNPTAAS